jgi:hypothetical protein
MDSANNVILHCQAASNVPLLVRADNKIWLLAMNATINITLKILTALMLVKSVLILILLGSFVIILPNRHNASVVIKIIWLLVTYL